MDPGESRVALGAALGRRALEATRRAEERIDAFPWMGAPPSPEYLESRRVAMWFGTMLVARWLVSGVNPEEEDLVWISERARRVADEGLSLFNMARGYLVWRDVDMEILAEEGRRIGCDPRILGVAQNVVRANCDGNLIRMARTFDEHLRDVSARLERERQNLTHSALHDQLTGLPNRLLLFDRLAHAVAVARRDARPLAVLLIDLDHFKEINDSFGHRHGDIALAEMARRLEVAVREADTVGRLGGDEFVAVLPGADERTAVSIAARMLAEVSAPLRIEQRIFELGASVGVALYPAHGEDPDGLVLGADRAMYVAKRAGGGVQVGAPGTTPSNL